jgi:aspartate carbamoyltransferase catalytic subunit
MKAATNDSAKNSSGELVWSGRRHLIDTADLTVPEIDYLLALAKKFKEGGPESVPLPPKFIGKGVANVFYENSTRTRSSFEFAGKVMRLNVVNVDSKVSSVNKGESIEDTGRNLAAMGFSIIIQRHSAAGACRLLIETIGDKVCIINAGEGASSHPTQALLDVMTMLECRDSLEGAKVAIVGDISYSRVARSNLWLLKLLGAEVHFAGPPTLMPSFLRDLGAHVHMRPEEALRDADFVMALRLQLERQQSGLIPSIGEYQRVFRIDHERLKLSKPGVKVLHPQPMNRDIEITYGLADDHSISLMDRQVNNGFALRMAIIHTLLTQTGAK